MAPKLFVVGIVTVFIIQGVICDCPPGSSPPPPPPSGPPSEPTPAPGTSPTPTPTPAPGTSPTPTPTPAPGTSPTPTPTPAPGTSPTPTPTPAPGTSPTPTPTPAPGTSPTPTPTPAPGISPTPTPGPSSGTTPGPSAPGIQSSSYPNPKRDESVVDTYGCEKIKDPYRWMENTECPEVQKFIEEEMAITKPYLEKSPFRAELQARYKELYDYEKFSGPFQKCKKFFSFKNTGLQNQDVLYVQDSITDTGKIFLDPNALSKDGTVSLDTTSFSDDGQIMAYATSVAGSDWQTLQFKHVEKGDIYKDKVDKIKFSNFPWTKDNKGVFYSAYKDQQGKGDGTDNTSNKNHRVYYHLLGNDPSKDVMVADYPDNPDYFLYAVVSDCGKYLIVAVSEGVENNMIYFAEIGEVGCEIKGKLQLKPLFSKMEAVYEFIGNNENLFIFKTNKDADNSKIITVDVTNPCTVKDLVPEQKDNLEWAFAAHDKYMVLCYTHEVKSVVQVHDITSGQMLKKFDLEIGTVNAGSFFSDRKSPNIFFNLECFLTPGITYHCDLSNPSFELKVIHEIKLKNFCRENFIVKQEFFKSKDGTMIPMYCVHKKDLKKDGKNPAFMYAYGEMNSSLLPYFTVNRLVVVGNFDGVHCAPNLRGGGEFGQKWHKAGMLDKKQNHFDDFEAAAEFLINQKYTSSKLLAVNGAGLTMAVGAEQRPELFGAVIGDEGVYDMLRFDNFTIGHAWVTEYGKPSDPKAFQNIIKYSPLHNVKIPTECDKQYPPIMLTTSDHDDRVPPLHSYKFIAELQFQAKSHPTQINPFILRVEKDAGIGNGLPTDKLIAEYVDLMSFIVINTGIQFHPCKQNEQNPGGP